jgi:hypothetical protein
LTATPYLVAAGAAFGFLFGTSVAVSAVLTVLEGRGDAKPPFHVEVLRHALWALLWTVLGLAPAVIAVRAAGESGLVVGAAALIVAAVAFARIGASPAAGPTPSRVLWGFLEATLVVSGLFLFHAIVDSTLS